ncbi:MAG: hypothetical protein ACTHMX_09230 [Thermomicrobiales bacterium]|jgi:hypothetical protein
MVTLFVILGIILLLAVVAIALWLWLFADILGHGADIVRIETEERMALWRLDAIRRQAETEMQRVRDAHRRRSVRDRRP